MQYFSGGTGMEFIEWNDGMSVGVEKFNGEHQQLIQFVNRLNQALKAGGARKELENILTGLVKYTAIHFTHEEEYMKIHDYPDYAAHKKEHDTLTAQVTDFFERFKSGSASFSLELLVFLKDWLVNHIMGTDMKYREFFTRKGV